ncbi:InlB B-repeat-containing protein, partial [Candidatus Symbiothrix dinenymphae]|uniref:InlB B-repeat-containing protein n=1 Tax=Candidatus Symbiothrix dinenymphae TaxID=467085 RepID=UPI0013963168
GGIPIVGMTSHGVWSDTTFYITTPGFNLPNVSRMSRPGYTFTGWNNSGGSPVSSIPAHHAQNEVFDAQWLANTYKLKFDKNTTIPGAQVTAPTIPSPPDLPYKVVSYDAAVGELPGDFASAWTATCPGYTFKGWRTAALSTVGSVWTQNTIYAVAHDTTLYAWWAPRKCAVNYDTNGGTLPAPYGDYRTATFTDSFSVEWGLSSLPTPTRSGYNFDGWMSNAALNGNPVTSIPDNCGT